MKSNSVMSTVSRISCHLGNTGPTLNNSKDLSTILNRVKTQTCFVTKYKSQSSDQWDNEFFKLHRRWKQKSVHTREGQRKVPVLINKTRSFPNQTAGGSKPYLARANMSKHLRIETSWAYPKRQNSFIRSPSGPQS